MNIPQALEFNSILERLAGKAVSPAGAQAARQLQPEGTLQAAQFLMKKTMEAETLLIKRPNYPLCSFSNIEAELKRMRTGASLSCAEILRVTSVFRAAKMAAPLAKDEGAEIIPGIAGGLY